MPYLFDHLDLIGELLRQPAFGVITDVDGTISETAPTPQQAKVSPLCRHYLAILRPLLAVVAAISGRPAVEVRNMIGIDGMVYIGNHGLDRWADGYSELTEEAKEYAGIVQAVIEELTPLLSIEGIRIEDKGMTASVHYRLCPEPESARTAILAALQKSPQARRLRIIEEKKAIDLIPPVTANKGTAVLDLIQSYDLRGGIYLGDDLTDIDAFRSIRSASRHSDFRGLAVGVISQEMPDSLVTEVDVTLNGVGDVERLLEWMSQTVAEPS